MRVWPGGQSLIERALAGAPARADALLIAGEIEQDRMVIANTIAPGDLAQFRVNERHQLVARLRVAGTDAL